MDKVYIVQKTAIPEDDERYTVILGVFATKVDALGAVKQLLREALEDLDLEITYKDTASSVEDLQNKVIAEWLPEWAAPRFEITSHKIRGN